MGILRLSVHISSEICVYFGCLLFNVPCKNLEMSSLPVKGYKISAYRFVLGAYGRCEGRDLYRVTPAVQG
jgi:hypothetical protein